MGAPVVIIGGGPAGIAAARVVVAAGLRPVVIDEARYPGGQIFRRPEPELTRSTRQLYGFDAPRAATFRHHSEAIEHAVDYRPRTQVWGVCEGGLHILDEAGVAVQDWSALIIATGGMDRLVPVKGWTGRDIYSLGGAQIALKAEASLIGRRVVFAGTGPLLYLVAYQYAKAGATVAGVLETSAPFDQFALLPALASGGAIFAKGLFYVAALLARGVPVMTGVRLTEVLRGADDGVTGLAYVWRGREHIAACDAVALGHGLKAETQLADLLGLEFWFDPAQRQWLPFADHNGRSSMANVYLAGDGLSIRGSEMAEASGRLAAVALLQDKGHSVPIKIDRDRRAIGRTARFRNALNQAFPLPHGMIAQLPDDVVICRCEGITAGTIRKTVASTGEAEINRIKAFCRVGMGRCQGRICGTAAAELIAAASNADIKTVGRLRGQAPIKPLTLGDLARGAP